MNIIKESTEGSYDAVLVGGLDYRSSDYPISQQVDILKKGLGSNKNVKGFRYNTPTSEILKFLKMNPKILVFLFSAGCVKALELSGSPHVDKNKLYIIEPYAASEKTKNIVKSAVSNGVPASNVFVGSSAGRGEGVVSGASDSGSSSHWGALTKVGARMSDVVVTKSSETSNTNSQGSSTNIKDVSFDISYTPDPKVKELQSELVAKGYYIGKYGENKDGIDGKYGPFTKAAHEAFKEGIPPEEFEGKRAQMAQEFIGDVGDSVLKNEFNFHLIPDGKNNYRSAQIPVTLKGKDYYAEVIKKYGIKTIIRFNGDGNDSRHTSNHPMTSIKEEKEMAESLGVNFYKLSSTKDQEKVNALLSQGNVLIHCAHGADRTGGNVGGYLMKIGFGDTEKIWNYTTKYNGWNRMVMGSPSSFSSGGYLKQAEKFGVRDLDHAKQLAQKKRVNKELDTSGTTKKNIIIGDSQVPYVDMNTTKAERISNNGGKASLWEGGKSVSWLISALNEYPVSPDVSNVVIVIGTNGGFGKYMNDNVPLLFKRLREKFPNAKFLAVKGSYGIGTLKNITDQDVENYYRKFSDQGATIIEPGIGKIEPHGNRPIYKKIGAAIDSLL